MKELIDQVHASPRVSWGAVFSGMLMSLTILAALSFLGTGSGWIKVVGRASPLGVNSMAVAWWLAACAIAFYAGGWFAGRLNPVGRVSDSVLHGLLAWSAASLVMLFLIGTGLGQVLIGATSAFGRAVVTSRAELTAESASQAARAAGWFGFATMLIEAAAAALGGRNGARHSHRERLSFEQQRAAKQEAGARRH